MVWHLSPTVGPHVIPFCLFCLSAVINNLRERITLFGSAAMTSTRAGANYQIRSAHLKLKLPFWTRLAGKKKKNVQSTFFFFFYLTESFDPKHSPGPRSYLLGVVVFCMAVNIRIIIMVPVREPVRERETGRCLRPFKKDLFVYIHSLAACATRRFVAYKSNDPP